jgi:hypothetical protein
MTCQTLYSIHLHQQQLVWLEFYLLLADSYIFFHELPVTMSNGDEYIVLTIVCDIQTSGKCQYYYYITTEKFD